MAEKSKVPVETLLKRFEEAKIYRRKFDNQWKTNSDYYYNNQWSQEDRIAWWQSEPIYNKIFEFVEIHRAYLSSNIWGLDVIPAGMPSYVSSRAQEGDEDARREIFDKVDKCNKLLDFLWEDNDMSKKLSELILYVFIYGTGILKCTFNPNMIGDDGIGMIETDVVSPLHIFPDPGCSDVGDASFIIEHHPVTFRWIIEHYPHKAEEVKKAGIGSTTEYAERSGDKPAGRVDNEEAARVDILECWYRDSSIEEDSDSPGGVKQSYPNGRMTLMTTTGVVLEDKPNPYTRFPYVRFVEIPRPNEFFGDCTVSRCIPIQKSINLILREIIDNGMWLVHGVWVADANCDVSPEAIALMGPRDMLTKAPGTYINREVGPPLPPHIFEMLAMTEKHFDRVAGIPDVLRGIVPGRQPVGTVEMQRDAGEIRTRERQKRIEEGLEKLAQLWLDIVSEHWVDKRVVRNRMMLGGFEMFEMSKDDLKEWKFDIVVIPGSTSARDVTIDFEKALMLRERAGIDIPPMFLVQLARIPGLYSAMSEYMALADSQAQDMVPPLDEQVVGGGEQPILVQGGEGATTEEDVMSEPPIASEAQRAI